MSVGGFFISLEGVEGTGKSTQARMLADALEARGMRTVLTAEPGGTVLSDKIRTLLLDVDHKGMDPVTELLLYAAARRQHLAELILPSLKSGAVVITDRFSDSTMAYQGFGRGLARELIKRIDTMVTDGLKPDLAILLDLDVREGLRRNKGANKVDRLELEAVEFHERVRSGFLEMAAEEPARFITIGATSSIESIHAEIMSAVQDRIDSR